MTLMRPRCFWHALTLSVGVLLVCPAGQISAQQVQPLTAPEGILVLNQDALFARSQFGQRVQQELEQAGERLAAENREIEAQLTEEEMRLTEERQGMDPTAFRVLADEFDTRVGEIRTAQDAKAQSLNDQADAARQQFFELAFPILLELVQDRGAAVIMDSRAVLLSAETVDITATALIWVDDRIGDGGEGPLLETDGPRLPVPRSDAGSDPATNAP
ncbi:OmpH family outer membrane protein [Rhodophyticola sp. CCM32]|uniref:OmpH family outer membrane protein n=1 Tax=Rhodophyticola sp. CCM32 TaxID=2916397 RepID=UPI00107F09DE|nr:OmpH family outer membrane protein [Rhodophyticola sp. CCM32]QBY00546.1 OmpH family outer membrane protein [Rhodophyticola sp. CCM32]